MIVWCALEYLLVISSCWNIWMSILIVFLYQEEVPIGSAKVRAVFSSGSGKVAGCMINTGKVVHDCNVRVLRKGKEVYMGTLDSLRRVKETVKEVCTINMNPSTIFISLHSLRKLFTHNITMCFLSITAKKKKVFTLLICYIHIHFILILVPVM